MRRLRLAVVAMCLAASAACAGGGRPGPPGGDSPAMGTPLPRSPPAPKAPTAPTPVAVPGSPIPGSPIPGSPGAARARAISRGDPSRRAVALTFDAGSDRGNAAAILDELAAEGIHATFGLTGTWVRANPDLARRMVAEGHQVVNHTWDHRSFTGASTHSGPLTLSQRIMELDRAEQEIRQTAGAGTDGWFRPPYGDRNAEVDADAAADGYRVDLLWTVDSLGWQGRSVAQITERCVQGAVPGAIMLFHVGAASSDAQALPGIITALRSSGYGFETAANII